MRWACIASLFAAALGLEAQSPLSSPNDTAPPYRAELLHLVESLVSIPSADGTESAVGTFLSSHLSREGWQVKCQDVSPINQAPDEKSRFNIIAWRGTWKPTSKVLLTSHIDVVPPYIPWRNDDAGGTMTRNTVLRGRGTADAKGSVAAMIVAVKQLLASRDVDGEDVMLVFVVGEEKGGDGMMRYSELLEDSRGGERPQFGAVIFGEPTENRLACGHKGALFCGLGAEGRAAHSGYPELGKSANELMVRAWARILDADLGSSDRFGKATVNIGRFEGGVAANVIPASAHVDFSVRVASGSEEDGQEEVRQTIRGILDDVDEDAFTLDCQKGYGPYAAECDVPGFETMVANYGTDIPNLKGDHVRYLYGPGSILVAHGAEEMVTVGQLEDAVEGYQRLILHALKE